MPDVIRRKKLLDHFPHGDGRVAVRGDLLEEQVDYLAPDIYAFAAARRICILRFYPHAEQKPIRLRRTTDNPAS